jgi:hypothetical protein
MRTKASTFPYPLWKAKRSSTTSDSLLSNHSQPTDVVTPSKGDALERPTEMVITLVHGAWARGSSWTKSHSKLYQRLDKDVLREKLLTHFPGSGRKLTEGANSRDCCRPGRLTIAFWQTWPSHLRLGAAFFARGGLIGIRIGNP